MSVENGDLAIIERGFHKWLDSRGLVTEEHCKGSNATTKLKIEEVEKDMTELKMDLKAIPDTIDKLAKSQRNWLLLVAAVLAISKMFYEFAVK